jgi:hypothetical protein
MTSEQGPGLEPHEADGWQSQPEEPGGGEVVSSLFELSRSPEELAKKWGVPLHVAEAVWRPDYFDPEYVKEVDRRRRTRRPKSLGRLALDLDRPAAAG